MQCRYPGPINLNIDPERTLSWAPLDFSWGFIHQAAGSAPKIDLQVGMHSQTLLRKELEDIWLKRKDD